MTVKEYLDAREYFSKNGRSGSGLAQKQARADYQKNLTSKTAKALQKSGMAPAEALQEAQKSAQETMKSLAALHEPDMIAGGKDKVTKLGDKKVNSSIGGQWKSRVKEIDEAAKNVAEGDRAGTKMNAKLPKCK